MKIKIKNFENFMRNVAYLFIISLPKSLLDIRSRQKLAKRENRPLHIVIMTGGLGDIIASEPTVRQIKKPNELPWTLKADDVLLKTSSAELKCILPEMVALGLLTLFNTKNLF
jgi:hypothetical protein